MVFKTSSGVAVRLKILDCCREIANAAILSRTALVKLCLWKNFRFCDVMLRYFANFHLKKTRNSEVASGSITLLKRSRFVEVLKLRNFNTCFSNSYLRNAQWQGFGTKSCEYWFDALCLDFSTCIVLSIKIECFRLAMNFGSYGFKSEF